MAFHTKQTIYSNFQHWWINSVHRWLLYKHVTHTVCPHIGLDIFPIIPFPPEQTWKSSTYKQVVYWSVLLEIISFWTNVHTCTHTKKEKCFLRYKFDLENWHNFFFNMPWSPTLSDLIHCTAEWNILNIKTSAWYRSNVGLDRAGSEGNNFYSAHTNTTKKLGAGNSRLRQRWPWYSVLAP